MQPLQVPNGDEKPTVGRFGSCCRVTIIVGNGIFLALCVVALLGTTSPYSSYRHVEVFQGSLIVSILISAFAIYGAVEQIRFLSIAMIIIYFGWLLLLTIFPTEYWYIRAFIVAFGLYTQVSFLTIMDYNRFPTVDSPV